jgi:hypothetical protein
MSKRHHILIAGVLLCALLVCRSFVFPRKTAVSSEIQRHRERAPLAPAVEGLSIPNYDSNGRQSSLLRVGTCQLRRKAAGLFGLGSDMVVQMNDVRVDVETPHDGSAVEQDAVKSELPNVVDSFREVPRFLRWNDVQDFEIQGIKVTVHDTAGAVSTIHAAKLSPLPKQQLFLSGGVVLTVEASRTQLASDQVVWWPRLGIYAVKGPYSLTREGQLLKGRRELFDVNLKPITNAQEIAEYENRATLTGSPTDNK